MRIVRDGPARSQAASFLSDDLVLSVTDILYFHHRFLSISSKPTHNGIKPDLAGHEDCQQALERRRRYVHLAVTTVGIAHETEGDWRARGLDERLSFLSYHHSAKLEPRREVDLVRLPVYAGTSLSGVKEDHGHALALGQMEPPP